MVSALGLNPSFMHRIFRKLFLFTPEDPLPCKQLLSALALGCHKILAASAGRGRRMSVILIKPSNFYIYEIDFYNFESLAQTLFQEGALRGDPASFPFIHC